MKLISVIIPVYNVEPYLRKCIESVQNQTYSNLEILLIDDGSTDKSADMCDEYAMTDSRIKVVHQENAGLSAARNAGLNIAKGEYLFFLDSDDYLPNESLEIFIDCIRQYQVDMVIGAWVWADQDGRIEEKAERKISEEKIISAKQFLYSSCEGDGWNNIVVWNKLYKKDIFNNLRFKEGKVHEDVFIFHQICAKCKDVLITPQKLYIHTRRSGSIMQSGITVKTLDGLEAHIDRLVYFDGLREAGAQAACVHELNRFFYLLFQYVDKYGLANKELNILLKKQRDKILKIIFVILQDNSKKNKERIALSVLLICPWIYDKIWGNLHKPK